jgi:PadR family transcriptional regulator, regulatory protein PadR
MEALPRGGLGEFERLVLLAILRLGERAYGATVIEELERRTQRAVASGAVYVALRRLEQKGMVSSHLGDPTPERGGRAKRFLRVEASGLEALREARAEWEAMTAGLEGLLEPSA